MFGFFLHRTESFWKASLEEKEGSEWGTIIKSQMKLRKQHGLFSVNLTGQVNLGELQRARRPTFPGQPLNIQYLAVSTIRKTRGGETQCRSPSNLVLALKRKCKASQPERDPDASLPTFLHFLHTAVQQHQHMSRYDMNPTHTVRVMISWSK